MKRLGSKSCLLACDIDGGSSLLQGTICCKNVSRFIVGLAEGLEVGEFCEEMKNVD